MTTPATPLISKTDKVRTLLAEGEDLAALRIAKSFRFLKDVKTIIQRGWSAHQNPGFARQIGRDPETDLADAIAALRSLYG